MFKHLNIKQPIVRPLPKSNDDELDRYELVEDYEIEILGYTRTIEAGFKFDGASIPRFLWSVLGVTPFHPKIMLPALIHDDIYDKKDLARAEADKIFKKLLELSGFEFRAWAMHKAVEWFGGSHWN